uniref:Uncharacterized protein n=1 Tax=Ganoderma boninense TaxID=34458 RepID=A0A5K1JU35_9APHY|nr:Uncharacterized protein [Ganoderma boninense]
MAQIPPANDAVPLTGNEDNPLGEECRRLRDDNLRLHRLLLDAEAQIGMRDRELSLLYTRLLLYSDTHADGNSEDTSEDSIDDVIGPSSLPRPFIPPPLRPTAAYEEFLKSSRWAQSGRPDPSVELYPLSSWYHWFRSTLPILDHSPIRTPPEPFDPSAEARIIPYSLPPYVFLLLGPEARQKDKDDAEKAQGLVSAGAKVKPPRPRADLYGDLGPWLDVKITTVLQAHNIRHAAITDRDIFAVRAYRHLHTTFTDRTERRSEGMQYLMKAFSADSHLLIPHI